MSPRASVVHPDHATEQAYIERVHEAAERSRERLEKLPESAGDRYSARKARERMLERLAEDIDPEALCFARIDREGGETFYLGREAVHGEGSKLLVVNWRMPVAAAFYTATSQNTQGLSRRRRFELDRI